MKKITLGLVLISYSFCFAQYYDLHWKDYNPYEFYFESYIQFINDSVGWVMPSKANISINNAMFKTTDGGNNWFCDLEFESNSLFSLFDPPFIFTDSDTGYYFSKIYPVHTWNVWKTTDGGLIWNNVYSFPQYSDYIKTSYFLNGKIGWIYLGNNTLYKTSDGGESWTLVYTFPNDLGFYKYLIFLSESCGYMLSTNNNHAYLYKTTNGQDWVNRATWTTTLRSISFVNESMGYITTNGKLFKTQNGGGNWEEIYIPGGGNLELVQTKGDIIVVSGLSSGYVSTLNVSTNAGFSWTTKFFSSSSIDNRIKLINIIDQDNIFLSLYYRVVKATNLGQYLSPVAIGPTYNLESIIEVPGGEVFAVGWKQDTLTLNFESSIISKHPLWRTRSIHQNQKLKCIAAKNNSELFIGGYDYLNGGRSVIYKCDNKGDNLELKYNSAGQIVNSMQFNTELNGIAVGDGGLLLKTQDGGNTWLQETVTTTEDLNFVKFSSEIGFIGGSNGLLLRTSDGGIN